LRIYDLQSYLEHFFSNVAQIVQISQGTQVFPGNCIADTYLTARRRRKILRIFHLQSYLEHFSSNVAQIIQISKGAHFFL